MDLIEADGKAILHRYGLPVPRGRLVSEGSQSLSGWTGGAVVKAQILAGKRGAAGLIKIVPADQVIGAIDEISEVLRRRGKGSFILVEETISIRQECYLAVRINDVLQCIELIFSPVGGMEIEGHAETLRVLHLDPLDHVRPHSLISFFREAGVEGRSLGNICRFAAKLCHIFAAEDASLIEINPLAITPSQEVIALDAKVTLDNASGFRHPNRKDLPSFQLQQSNSTELEKLAAARKIIFIELEGEVALLTGGAGIGMLVFDSISDAGFRPSNFVDATAGSDRHRWRQLGEFVFDYAEREGIRAIVAYFTLSVTPLKSLVDGLLDLLAERSPPKPMIIGLQASGAAEAELSLVEAQELLRARGIECLIELPDVIDKLSSTLVKSRY